MTGAAAAAAEALAAGMSYADWMRSVTTMAVEMEVNTQLGEFTVRKNRLKALQRSVKDMPDFHAALGATLAAQQSGGDAGGTSFGDPRGAGRGAEVDDTFFSGSSPSLGGLVSAGVDGGGADDDPDGAGYDSDGAASRDGSSGVSDVVVHCAEVRRSEHRLWMRLVGLRHDVQLWDADHRAPSCPFNRRYQPLFTNAQIAAGLAGAAGAVSSLVASVGVAGLAEDERWIAERLDPVAAGPAAGYLAGVELFLPVAKVRGPIAHLAGFAKLPEVGGPERGDEHAAWGFEPGKNLPEGVGDKTGASGSGQPSADSPDDSDEKKKKKRLGALTEVVVLRDPPLVQVYRVESYGRRWRRALVFASAAAWCLADIDPDGHPALEDPSERYLLSAARLGAAQSSLVVSRHLTEKQGRQRFVPARHLRGLIPAAILREYVFWQGENGDLYGDATAEAKHPRSVIHARLLRGGGFFSSGGADSDALGLGGAGGEYAAFVRRIPLGDGEPGSEGIAPGTPVPEGYVPGQLALVDLLYAPATLGEETRDATTPRGSSPTPARKAAAALRSLAKSLAAVEGLAHCLAWTSARVDPDRVAEGGLGGIVSAVVDAVSKNKKGDGGVDDVVVIDRLELPRLGISFAAPRGRDGGGSPPGGLDGVGPLRLECEEHAGLFLSARRSVALDALLAGLPHSLLLEGRDGSLSVLLPASAAPRPALDRAIAGAAPGESKDLAVTAAEEAAAVGTKGFGTDTVLDRWDHDWTKNANAGGGGHYVYPVHGSHATMAAASLPAALYLTLLRFLARRYSDVCKLADLCVSEAHPTPEEAQLWRAFSGVANDPSPDACAARLRLSVAAFGTPAELLLPWRVEPELAQYVAAWRHVSANCRLTADEERELLEACSAEGMKAPLLANRASYLYIRAKVAEEGKNTNDANDANNTNRRACPLAYPDAPAHSAFDAVEDRTCLEEGIQGEGPLGSLAGLKHSFVQYEERELTGAAGLRMIGEWLDQGSFALDGAHGFPLLFELLTGTVPLRVLPTDEPHRWGAALLRFVPPEQSLKRGTLMSVLRALASSKFLADQAPKVEERGMSARMAAVFTQDGAIGMLLRRVQPFLRERFRDLPGGEPASFAAHWLENAYEPPLETDAVSGPRDASAQRWALPKFPNAACRRRAFPLTHHLGGEKGPWGGPNLDAVDVAALADAPLSQLGLEKFFENPGASSAEKEKDAERERVRALASASAKNEHAGGLPFAVAQHAAAATPIARQTLARLRADVKLAAERVRDVENARARGFEDSAAARENAPNPGSLPEWIDEAHVASVSPAAARAIAREALDALEANPSAALDDVRGGGPPPTPAAGSAASAALASLRSILGALRALTSADRAAAAEAAAAAASVANGLSRDPGAARSMLRLGLNRRSGAWAEATFDDLVEGLLCDGAERVLARVTPGVGERGAAAALHLAAEALLLTSRAAQSARAAAAAEECIAAVEGARRCVVAAADAETGLEACAFGVDVAAKTLADALRARRHYFDATTSEESSDESRKNLFTEGGSGAPRAPPSSVRGPRSLARTTRACSCLSTRSLWCFAAARWRSCAISSPRRAATARSARRCSWARGRRRSSAPCSGSCSRRRRCSSCRWCRRASWSSAGGACGAPSPG